MAKYSYDGLVHPAPPEAWDSKTHPYAFICRVINSTTDLEKGDYFVVADKLGYIDYWESGVQVYTLGGSDLQAEQAKPISFVRWKANGDEWELVETDQLSNIYVGNSVVWTNTTLYDENGAFYLFGTEPVPAFDLKSFLNVLAAGLCSKARIGTKLPPAVYLAAGLRTEKREPVTYVSYLYNGTKLPALPKYDKNEFPCAFICTEDDVQKLVLCQFAWQSNRVTYIAHPVRYYKLENNKWAYFSTEMDKKPGTQFVEDADSHTFWDASVWSNMNLYSEDGTELRLSASDPVPVYEDGILTEEADECLYNGVRLPALPEWDKETYPYAVIHKSSEDEDVYFFVAVPGPVTLYGIFSYVDGKMSGYSSIRMASINGEQWVLAYETIQSQPAGMKSYYTWSNHDICDNNTGSLVFEASDPVPV